MSLPAELEALCDASALVSALAKVNARRWSEGRCLIGEALVLAELEDRCRAVAAAKRVVDAPAKPPLSGIYTPACLR